MTRKLTLFLVCAFEIALILSVASAAKSFDAGTHKLQLACRTTHVVTFLSGGPTAMNNYSFNITVNKDFIEFGADTLKREPSSISSKVFGYGHGALPHYDDE
ncbi:hypothetical protein OAS89_05865 [Alphaproteobacteria bacterium]|nr:hypothetical protein [Alphaproteobacteria bacterium]